MDAAYCHAFWLVEERDGFVVLSFAVLDNETPPGLVAIDGERRAPAVLTWIALQPREAMLAKCSLLEYFVAKIYDIGLVAAGAALGADRVLRDRRERTPRAPKALACRGHLLVGELPRRSLLAGVPRERIAKPAAQPLPCDAELPSKPLRFHARARYATRSRVTTCRRPH